MSEAEMRMRAIYAQELDRDGEKGAAMIWREGGAPHPESVNGRIVRAMLAAEAAAIERERRVTQSVWRCAIGDVSSALDMLKNKWIGSPRKAERQAGEVLGALADYVWAARSPAPEDYDQAADAGKAMIARISTALKEGASHVG